MRECPTCGGCLPDDASHCPTDGAATTRSITGEPILDGRYQLERRLGSGGMGVVFKARHVFLKTLHAIKIILPDLIGNDPNLSTRFRQEALAAAAIRHQNIIAVTDFGITSDNMPFLVMEFVQGKSLQEIMADEGAMPPLRAMELMEPICSGIAAAHRQTIIHRDLKPLNVMIQDGVPVDEGVKILDFGLAKIKSGEVLGSFVAAQTTGLLGSPYYMAPEQWSDESLDAHSDIYSLGIMLYQMLCGEVPFKGGSIPAIMKRHLTEPVPSFASKGVEVAPEIEAAVRRALEKDPKNRTSSADTFIGDLRDAMTAASATLKRTAESLVPGSAELAPEAPHGAARETIPLSQATGVVDNAAMLQEEEARLAREKLQQEAEAKQKLAEEEQRKKQAAEAARERERKQLEAIDRKQTRVLDEKPPPASHSISERSALLDPEETKLQTAIGLATAGIDPFSHTAAQSFSQLDVKPDARPRKTALFAGIAVLAVLLIGGGLVGLYSLRAKLLQPSKPVETEPPKENPIKANLIEIPGGTFQMGRNSSTPTEGPPHAVTIQSFFMDKTEVTNAEYEQFISDTNHAPPTHWTGGKPPAGSELLPVSNVDYEDAVAFAEWRSKRDSVRYRLPTEEEWEYAARNGEKDDLYPWGNTWIDGCANTEEAGIKAAQPVGTYPLGNNSWGIQDLLGNVWEWTSSKASLYKGNPDQLRANQVDWIVIRGGGYSSSLKTTLPGPVSSTLRTWDPPADFMNPVIGFRLVRPANAEASSPSGNSNRILTRSTQPQGYSNN